MTDYANTSLLLETLASDLSPEVRQLLGNNTYKENSLQFLGDLLNQAEDADVLLTTNLRPSLEDGAAAKSLIEQVAELESTQRTLENQLQQTVFRNLDLALGSNATYQDCVTLFNNDFVECCEFLSTNFSRRDEPNEEEDENDQTEHSEESSWKDLLKIQAQQLPAQDAGQSPSIVLRNMDGIMDILELPALANACVKSGHYAECVEIASHVRRLAIRYSDIALIKQVEQDMQREIKEMVNGLIRLLNTDLRQSSIVKVVTYLKRIGPFQSTSESARGDIERVSESISSDLLQKIFLKSRYQFILNELDILVPLKKSNSTDRYLKRCLEVIREHCFQTVVTFESLFPSETKNAQLAANKPVNSLLYSFIRSLVLRLCAILRGSMPQLAESNRDGLLLQLVYCSQSLARISGDFNLIILDELRGLVDPGNWCLVLRKQRELVRSLSVR